MVAATYARFSKRAGETNGCGAFVMRQTKLVAASAAPRKLPYEASEAKLATCPCVTPKRKSPVPEPSRMAPAKSK